MSRNDNNILQFLYENMNGSLRQEELSIITDAITNPPFNLDINSEPAKNIIWILTTTDDRGLWAMAEEGLRKLLNTNVPDFEYPGGYSQAPTVGDTYIRSHYNSESIFNTSADAPNYRKKKILRYLNYLWSAVNSNTFTEDTVGELYAVHIMNSILPRAKQIKDIDNHKYDRFENFKNEVLSKYTAKYSTQNTEQPTSDQSHEPGDILFDTATKTYWLALIPASHNDVLCVKVVLDNEIGKFSKFFSKVLYQIDKEKFWMTASMLDLDTKNKEATTVYRKKSASSVSNFARICLIVNNGLRAAAKMNFRLFAFREKQNFKTNDHPSLTQAAEGWPATGDIIKFDWSFADQPDESKKRPVCVIGSIGKDYLIIAKMTSKPIEGYNSIPVTDANIAKFYPTTSLVQKDVSYILPDQLKTIQRTKVEIVSRIKHPESFMNIWMKVLDNFYSRFKGE